MAEAFSPLAIQNQTGVSQQFMGQCGKNLFQTQILFYTVAINPEEYCLLYLHALHVPRNCKKCPMLLSLQSHRENLGRTNYV